MRGLSKGFRERQISKIVHRRNMVASFVISSMIPVCLALILTLIPVKHSVDFDWPGCPGPAINVVFAQTIDTNQSDSSKIDDKTDDVLKTESIGIEEKGKSETQIDSNMVEDKKSGDSQPDSSEFTQIGIMATKIKEVKPKYPAYARQINAKGVVWVKVFVGIDGNVKEAVVVKDSGTDIGFEKATVEAALKTKWKPAEADGKPVPLWVTYKVTFGY